MVSFTKHFKDFLLGRKFKVVTDHQALVWLHSVKDPSSRLMRWRLRLSDCVYEIHYRAGKTLQNADGLSRNPVNDSIALIFMLQSNPKRKPGRPRKQVKFEHVPEPRLDSLDDPGGFGIASRVRLRNRAARDHEQTPHTAHEPAREAVLKRRFYMDSLADDADIDSEPEATMARHYRKTLFNEEDRNYVPQLNDPKIRILITKELPLVQKQHEKSLRVGLEKRNNLSFGLYFLVKYHKNFGFRLRFFLKIKDFWCDTNYM